MRSPPSERRAPVGADKVDTRREQRVAGMQVAQLQQRWHALGRQAVHEPRAARLLEPAHAVLVRELEERRRHVRLDRAQRAVHVREQPAHVLRGRVDHERAARRLLQRGGGNDGGRPQCTFA
jgi:hypothetical protein